MIDKRFLKLCQPGALIGAALLGLAAMGGGNAAPAAVVRVDSGGAGLYAGDARNNMNRWSEAL
jgi:hypothetical protein